MNIVNVNRSEIGLQVITKCAVWTPFIDNVIEPGHPHWPRLKAAGTQLLREIQETGLDLVRVDQRSSGEKQFSFKKGPVHENQGTPLCS